MDFSIILPGLPVLCAELVRHGLPSTTPAAIVQQGTFVTQRVVTGTLKTLPRRAERAGLHGPTLIIVGDVVRLRARLNWFKARRKSTRRAPRHTAKGGGNHAAG